TSYSDRNLEPGTTYYYRVRAFNSVGPSPFSNEASGRTWSAAPGDGHASLTYDAQTNQVNTTGFAYDAAGNQVRALGSDGAWQRYQYDAAGRLIRIMADSGAPLEVYSYGAGRQRLKVQYGDTSNVRTYYVWDGNTVISEYNESEESPSFPAWAKSYVYMGP